MDSSKFTVVIYNLNIRSFKKVKMSIEVYLMYITIDMS